MSENKYFKVAEDTEDRFDKIRNDTAIPNWVEIRIMGCDKQKQIYKTMKMSDLVETMTDGVNFVVVLNEKIFDQLPENFQNMVLEESLAGVRVSETDALSLEAADFVTYTGFLEKYGNVVITLKESIKSIFESEKQKEEEAKAAAKAAKGKKSN